MPAGTANTVLFNEAGLTIVGACAAGSALSLTATTSKGASSIFTFSNDDGTPADPLEDDFENAGFDPGDTLDLFAGDDADIAQVQFGYSNTDNQSVIGSLYTDEGGTPNCLVTGFITFG